MTKPIHTLRSLLRLTKTPALPKELLRKQQSPPLENTVQTFLLQQFKQNTASYRLLETYHQLQKDIAERGRLYELDTGAEVVLSPKELTRRAAARVGLDVPLASSNHEEHEDQQESKN